MGVQHAVAMFLVKRDALVEIASVAHIGTPT
ncbi:hypothetical protein SM68_01066 [Klebsiella pneumoniae]|nr:hypothetical protein SM68_01066 [Klebsiella pneumoniae]